DGARRRRGAFGEPAGRRQGRHARHGLRVRRRPHRRVRGARLGEGSQRLLRRLDPSAAVRGHEVETMNAAAKALRPIATAALVGAAIGALGKKTPLLDLMKGMSLTPAMRVSVGVWFVFSVYWSIASKDKAPTRSGESIWSRQAHVIAVNVALL